MRVIWRLGLAAVAAGGTLATAVPAARAETAPIRLLESNWFWHDQVDGQIGPTGVGQRVPGATSGTPDGELGVGYTDGKSATAPLTPDAPQDYPEDTPDKEAYLRFDLSAVPVGSTVTSFELTVVLDEAASTPQLQDPVPLVACAAVNDWSPGSPPYGDPFSGKPGDDCGVSAAGTWDEATASYTFDATAIAQGWVTSGLNLGLGIRQRPGGKTPFQFNLKPELTTADVAYVPPPASSSPPSTPVPVLPPGLDVDPPLPAVVGTTTTPQPEAAPAPSPVTVAQPATIPRAAVAPFLPDLGPTAGLWLALVTGLVLLAVTSLALGRS